METEYIVATIHWILCENHVFGGPTWQPSYSLFFNRNALFVNDQNHGMIAQIGKLQFWADFLCFQTVFSGITKSLCPNPKSLAFVLLVIPWGRKTKHKNTILHSVMETTKHYGRQTLHFHRDWFPIFESVWLSPRHHSLFLTWLVLK